MTIYHRLFVWMLLLFSLLLTGIFYSQIKTTRSFLVEQQSVEMRNAMNAVGLALSPYLKASDPVIIESVINAIFDGSFYQKVTLEVFEPKTRIERQYPVAPTTVPHWFQQWVTIPSATQTNTITSGWLQLAKITVTSHSSIAYSKLWQNAKQLMWTFGTCMLFGMVLLKFILDRLVKRPLEVVQQKAKDIAKNDFGEPLAEPNTRELKDMVIAFNQMSLKLKQHFSQQANEADLLRKRAYQDPDSGLGNRRLLQLQLEEWLTTDTLQSQHGLMIISIPAFSQLRQTNNYAASTLLAKAVGTKLASFITPSRHIGRLSHSEFLFITNDQSKNTLSNMANSLRHELMEIIQSTFANQRALQADHEVEIGIILKNKDKPGNEISLSQLLAQCDNVRAMAKQKTNKVAIIDDNQAAPSLTSWGKQQWLELIHHALKENQLIFTHQRAINKEGNELHRELFTAIQYQGKTFSASQFFPPLEALDNTVEIDKYILEHAMISLQNKHHVLAVNLAPTTVTNGGFVHWLNRKLQQSPTLSQQLIFELPEAVFIHFPEHVKLLCNIITTHSFSFGIDSCGTHFNSSYLQHFRPRYIKLDFTYTSQLDEDIKTDALKAITRAAANLDIISIATRVETRQQLESLDQLGVQGFQGFAVEDRKNHGGQDRKSPRERNDE
ncbi:EAL domain-containing protein [Photobacterium makurazakiensis]|uniref:bifunctional diguanylate cyclase/phosphodiesterase n=1 Tax=Photobacterium makurazakiensis TaxID=2910234 RepID=UPI003D138D08